jgi:hypothetical protein
VADKAEVVELLGAVKAGRVRARDDAEKFDAQIERVRQLHRDREARCDRDGSGPTGFVDGSLFQSGICIEGGLCESHLISDG